MKKSLLFVAGVLSFGVAAFGQASSYPLFEHFTQASCGPCAAQNPTFQSTILNVYQGQINHIAFHTSWPGVDPMYTFNAAENDARTSYYGVTGVPTMIMDGSDKGSPVAITAQMVDDAKAGSSPLKLRVTDTDMGGGSHNVTIDVYTAGNVTGSSLKIRAAVVEQDVNYGSPPGSNGETYFPNVMRDMIPNASGDNFTPAACGSAATYNYSYTEDASWDMSEIYVIAWIQDDATKEVINSGSSLDSPWYAMGCEAPMEDGSPSVTNDFDLNLYNAGSSPEQYRITLTHNAPAGWSTDFDVMSSTYTSTVDVTINGGSSELITLNVTPDATAAWADFTFEIESLDNPGDPHEFIGYTVVSGITDLIVNNDEGWGDGGSHDWESDYVSGLTAAGNTTFASATASKFVEGINQGILTDVLNIYFNISWTFPSFTDSKVAALESFLDNGGNMFVAGQDIGWDTWDAAANGTATTQAFYTNYLSTTYLADGGAGSTQLTWNTGDPIFGAETNSSLSDAYGGGYFYPDELSPITPAVSIYTYNSGATVGGTRVQESGHKIVYLGVDTRMIDNASVRDRVIWISHDWFYGIVTDVEFDEAFATAMGQNYPNPSNSLTTIPFTNLEQDVTLKIMDLMGRSVLETTVAAGTTQLEISTNELAPGVYQYAIISNDGSTSVKTMEVIR